MKSALSEIETVIGILNESKELGAKIMELVVERDKTASLFTIYMVWKCLADQEPEIADYVIKMADRLPRPSV